MLNLKGVEGATCHGVWQPLGARKGKEMASPQEPPEGTVLWAPRCVTLSSKGIWKAQPFTWLFLLGAWQLGEVSARCLAEHLESLLGVGRARQQLALRK